MRGSDGANAMLREEFHFMAGGGFRRPSMVISIDKEAYVDRRCVD